MRHIIIIISLFVAYSASVQAQHPVDMLKTHFSDSGYVSTKKWAKSYSPDTSGLLLRVLNTNAAKYYDDAISYRLNLDIINDGTQWTEQLVSLKQKNNKFTYTIAAFKAQRFGITAHQVNTDMYYVLSKKFYANVDVAVGDRSLYPMYRGAAKLYFTDIKRLELSVGYSYIQFYNNPVQMTRLAVGAYLASLYLHVEYLSINTQNDNSHAVVAMLRSYLGNSKGYFSLNGAAGMQANKFNLSGSFVNSSRLSVGFNYKVLPRFSIDIALATEKQTIREDFSREILSINVGVFYHFQTNKKK